MPMWAKPNDENMAHYRPRQPGTRWVAGTCLTLRSFLRENVYHYGEHRHPKKTSL